MTSTVRIGVAVQIPEPHASVLVGWRRRIGDPEADKIPPHVTLLPPTDFELDQLDLVEKHLVEAAATVPPFTMRLSGTGTFRPLSPVVYVRVVEGGEACGVLQKQVRDASGPVARELQFPYHPHVTVAHGIDDEAMDRAFEGLADFEAEWPCTGFALYEQGADGVWRKLREYTFGRSAVPPQAGHVERGTIPSR